MHSRKSGVSAADERVEHEGAVAECGMTPLLTELRCRRTPQLKPIAELDPGPDPNARSIGRSLNLFNSSKMTRDLIFATAVRFMR